MVLSIKNAKADQMARDLAQLTGMSITDAVTASLEAQLEVERRRRRPQELDDIVERFRELPVLDERSVDEIVGYGDHGLPA